MFRRLRTFWYRKWRWIVLAVALALLMTAAAYPNRQRLARWDWTAIGTLSLAVATVWTILQARAHQRDELHQRDMVAFRAALMEIWDNVQHISGWSRLEERPSKRWRADALTFAATKNLLAVLWVPSKLWYRISTVIRNAEAYATRIDDAIAKG